MICKEYDNYKSSVLNSLDSGHILELKNKDEYYVDCILDEKNCPEIRSYDSLYNYNVAYSSPDYGKKVSEMEVPRYKLGHLFCVSDELGNKYGEELIQYLFNNHLICGHLKGCSYHNYDKINSYDDNGISTYLKNGLMICGMNDFLRARYRSYSTSYYTTGIFCVGDIDADGIIVLPPTCTGICLLDKSLVSKIKKIIGFMSSSIEPFIFYFKEGSIVTDMTNETVEYVDATHITFDIYTNDSSISVSRYSHDYSDILGSNNKYVYAFKNINIYETSVIKGNEKEVYSLRINYLDTPINIYFRYKTKVHLNIDKYNSDLSISNIEEDLLVTLYRISDNINLNIQEVKNLYLDLDRCDIDGILNLIERVSNVLKENSNLILLSKKAKLFMKDRTDIFDGFLDMISKLKENNINIMVYFTDKAKIVELESCYDIKYYILKSVLDFLLTFYGHSGSILDIIESSTHKEDILNCIDFLFKTCETTYGNLNYLECVDKFCKDGMDIEFTDILVEQGLLIGRCGAGVTLKLNYLQLFLLRISGLYSHNYIRLQDNVHTDALYNIENSNSRVPLYSVECLVFSNQLNNPYKVGVSKHTLLLCFGNNSYTGVRYGSNSDVLSLYSMKRNGEGKNTIHYRVNLAYSEKGDENFTYVKSLSGKPIISTNNEDIVIYHGKYETTWKNIKEILSLSKSSFYRKKEEQRMLSFTTNSRAKGLYGGVSVKCLNCDRLTSSKLPEGLVMDSVKSLSDYCVFTLKREDNGEEFKIDNKTLYRLLMNKDIISDDLNYTLIENEVLWLKDDYDKEATESIERMINAKTTFTVDGETDITYDMEFESGYRANTYIMAFANIGEELSLPSYITMAIEKTENKNKVIKKYGEEDWTDLKRIGIEVGSKDSVDVTSRINSLLGDITYSANQYNSDTSPATSSVARRNNMEFYCGENAYYKSSKPLVIHSLIANKLLELPKNMSLDFCYRYYIKGISNEYNHDVKVVIRDGSTIYSLTTATEIDIADNCLIHKEAFRSSRLKKCVIHGGMIPVECFSHCKDFEELVVDGGNVTIDVSAFNGCNNFKSITCINGGTYSLLNIDNKIVLDNLMTELNNTIPFYVEVFSNYNKSLEIEFEETVDVIPYKLNDNLTVQLKHRDGKESALSVDKIANMLDKGALNFTHTLKSGKVINFIEKLKCSGLRCLVFYPGINNDFCNFKVLLLIDMDSARKIYSLKPCNFIFAYQEEDWKNGNIIDVPLKYLTPIYKGGIYFDSVNFNNNDYDEAIIYHFWQNMSYYTKRNWDLFEDYYRGGRNNYRPEDNNDFFYDYGYRKEDYDTLYMPASHEFSWYYKKLDASGDKKNIVGIGGLNKYGRCMHNKRYVLPKAHKVVLLPGIGENCLFKISPVMSSGEYSHNNYLWRNCFTLEIRTETVIEPHALSFIYNYDEEYMSRYDNTLRNLDIYSDTEISLSSCLFENCVVYNSGLKINCLKNLSSCHDYLFTNGDKFIKFVGDCRFIVNNLKVEQALRFIELKCYNFAYQLIVNSDTYDELIKNNKIKEFLDSCKTGNIKIKRVIKKPIKTSDFIIEAKQYKPPKIEQINVFSDDVDEDEKQETVDERIENSLSSGIIPDILTLDYIESNVDKLDTELYSEALGLKKKDDNIDFMSLDIPNSSDVLVEMCQVDVEKLQKEQDEYNKINTEIENETLDCLHQIEEERALEQQSQLLDRLNEEENLKHKVLFESIEEDKKKKHKEMKIKARKAYDIKKQNEKVKPEIEINNVLPEKVEKVELVPDEIKDNIFNMQNSIKNLSKTKPSGLASALLASIAENYNNMNMIELIIGEEVYKQGKVVGYVVTNTENNIKKKLSIENIKKLSKNPKYRVIGLDKII